MPQPWSVVVFELLRRPFSNREWVLLGILQGACGGLVGMVIGIVWSAVRGEWTDVLVEPLFVPCVALFGMVNAFLGIPVYRWLVRQLALADKTTPTSEGGNAA